MILLINAQLNVHNRVVATLVAFLTATATEVATTTPDADGCELSFSTVSTMAGRLAGKVALITGAASGQGMAAQLIGEERIIWASDYPHFDAEEDCVGRITGRADLSESAKRKILGENAARLYNL